MAARWASRVATTVNSVRFVLASASPARLAVLRSAGIEPVVRVSGVDEDAVTTSLTDPSPAELVTTLATAKAESVVAAIATELPDCVIVGCDSMLLMPRGDDPDGGDNAASGGRDIVGKPATPEIAVERWRRMGGSTGELLTGHCVVRLTAGRVEATAQEHLATTVRFAQPTDAELEAYVATGEPLRVAGGFTLDGFGGWFVDGIDGDPSSVIGISLPLTRQLLTKVGLSVSDLWQGPAS